MVLNKEGFKSNRTHLYLMPCLQYYDQSLFKILRKVPIKGYAINDVILTNMGIYYDNHIFIGIDASHYLLGEVLDEIRERNEYEYDYPILNTKNLNVVNHCIVIKLPIIHWVALQNFKNGQYSKMYSSSQIDKYFDKYSSLELFAKTKGVLLKSDLALEDFKIKLNKKFDLELTNDELLNHEYDFPIDLKEEVLNYN